MTNSIKLPAGEHRLEDPHQKGPLTTPVGRFVERASYLDLCVAGCATILLSATYFTFAPCSHSLNSESGEFLSAVYFSVVTFTSLGYGELHPQGLGRVVAAGVVMLGLAFIALLVGKFASERQHSILLLLHTSDCQRRINDFTLQLSQRCIDLDTACTAANLASRQANLKLASERLEVVSNYLVFNSNQARLVEFGNESSLFSLYCSLANLQSVCIGLHKAEKEDILVSRRAHAVANRCLGIVKLMLAFHRDAVRRTSYLGSLMEVNRPVF